MIGGAKPLVVVDFDGTLTLADVGDEICERFADPSWRRLAPALERREVSMMAAQAEMWRLVRGSASEIERFVGEVGVLRDGAAELLDAGDAGEIDLVLASGGFDFYIDVVLAPWRAREAFRARYSNAGKLEGDRVTVSFPHTDLRCDYCAVCKRAVIERHREADRAVIFVGDGVTDLCAARVATEVFAIAGGSLETLCAAEGIRSAAIDSLWPVLDRARRSSAAVRSA